MPTEQNLINVQALGEAKSIDYVNRMTIGLKKLFEALSVTNKIPMNVGSVVKQYRFKVVDSTQPNGDVAEGDEIPLTKVEREKVIITELQFKKFRKSTSAEAIQSHGYSIAVDRTDKELLRHVQKKFRADFFATLKEALDNSKRTNKKVLKAESLQGALAKGRANLSVLLDDEITPIAFVNPNDVAEHLANGLINSNGAVFGMNLLTNYVGARVIEFSDIPEGEIWLTTSENLNVAYANPNGDLSLAFSLTTDETGFIGVIHNSIPNRLTTETIFAHAIKLFPENIDAVVRVKIEKKASTPASA
ncbi:capsid protein [Mammaliicoccus sciuri]|uniref:capsid protein n=1 Tax=Mammaliicoccus sciuri TaxID=1296 RepID=UPI0036E0B199